MGEEQEIGRDVLYDELSSTRMLIWTNLEHMPKLQAEWLLDGLIADLLASEDEELEG